ncbi:unnamed protein product [Phaeothamnion confervicola]
MKTMALDQQLWTADRIQYMHAAVRRSVYDFDAASRHLNGAFAEEGLDVDAFASLLSSAAIRKAYAVADARRRRKGKGATCAVKACEDEGAKRLEDAAPAATVTTAPSWLIAAPALSDTAAARARAVNPEHHEMSGATVAVVVAAATETAAGAEEAPETVAGPLAAPDETAAGATGKARIERLLRETAENGAASAARRALVFDRVLAALASNTENGSGGASSAATTTVLTAETSNASAAGARTGEAAHKASSAGSAEAVSVPTQLVEAWEGGRNERLQKYEAVSAQRQRRAASAVLARQREELRHARLQSNGSGSGSGGGGKVVAAATSAALRPPRRSPGASTAASVPPPLHIPLVLLGADKFLHIAAEELPPIDSASSAATAIAAATSYSDGGDDGSGDVGGGSWFAGGLVQLTLDIDEAQLDVLLQGLEPPGYDAVAGGRYGAPSDSPSELSSVLEMLDREAAATASSSGGGGASSGRNGRSRINSNGAKGSGDGFGFGGGFGGSIGVIGGGSSGRAMGSTDLARATAPRKSRTADAGAEDTASAVRRQAAAEPTKKDTPAEREGGGGAHVRCHHGGVRASGGITPRSSDALKGRAAFLTRNGGSAGIAGAAAVDSDEGSSPAGLGSGGGAEEEEEFFQRHRRHIRDGGGGRYA